MNKLDKLWAYYTIFCFAIKPRPVRYYNPFYAKVYAICGDFLLKYKDLRKNHDTSSPSFIIQRTHRASYGSQRASRRHQ
ncbi:hypothetical protein [Moraxella lacunata]|uniref:hypothetical protein n=1 Tax=Moraxella lacunata TaxID=477 RepID=UPI003EE3DA8B